MDIIKKFNLPSYVKGKTFAEAAKIISKKFEDRTDPESIATLNEIMSRHKAAQEYVKAEQDKKSQPQQAATTQLPAGDEGGAEPLGSEPYPEVPRDSGNNSFEDGGLLGKLGLGAGASAPGIGGYMGAASAVMDMGKEAFGPTGIDTSGAGATRPDAVASKGGAALSGAMKGVMAGAGTGNPLIAAGMGLAGGVAGLVGGGKAQKDFQTADFNFDAAQHNNATNSYKSGGQLLANMYGDGGPTDPTDPYKESEDLIAKMRGAVQENQFNQMGLDENALDSMDQENKMTSMKEFSDSLPENNSYSESSESKSNEEKPKAKFNPAELLRYAPAVMNAGQLLDLKKPNKVGLDRLGNKYNEQLIDERELQNTVQESVNNNRNAILSSSGGSGSAARSNLLASQLQGSKALSSAYQSAGAENRQEKRQAQNFDLGVDQANLGQSNQEVNLNLEQEAAYKNNKSKLLAQLGQDLGGIGQEELFKKYPELMGLSYNSKGKKIKTV